ncbi:hypothetical protein LOD99_10814 [Oopsacas minuta]|uniref:14-3-3 domain-containing protein n=1 Tax=Oopsacas minuta TaxID=111878 RepID=A0AAV7KDN3_9METZ|nr:hypothetical protein LOD99_10814 [Oopsacas minuta]
MEDCEKVLYNAELSEQTERFQDMAKYMRLFVVDRERLNLYQRSLLSIACKNVIGELRASWRVVSSIMSSEKDEAKLSIIKKYKLKLEREMDENCEEVQDTLERLILGSKDDPDAMVFYHKMSVRYLWINVRLYPRDWLQIT